MRLRSFLPLMAAASAVWGQSASPGVVARLSSQPPLSAEHIAELESGVQADPTNIAMRTQLLRFYQEFAPTQAHLNPAFRLARLRHILYLIENQPNMH